MTQLAVSREAELKKELTDKYQKVVKKLASITEVEEKAFKTNGKFQFNPVGRITTDLHQVNLKDLLTMTGFLLTKEKEYNDAVEVLGLATAPLFRWVNYTKEEWLHDFKLRAQILTIDQDKKIFGDAKRELEKFFSNEDKLVTLLEKLSFLDK